jgi:hypothetical protein
VAENHGVDECVACRTLGGKGRADYLLDDGLHIWRMRFRNLVNGRVTVLGSGCSKSLVQLGTELGLDVRVIGEIFEAPAEGHGGSVMATDQKSRKL